jgi:uncharacterized protein YeaO (DUF488 family)
MNKKVCRKLCDYLIDVRLDIDDYWDNIKPLVDKAYSNGFISKNTIQKQKDFIVKEYESRIKRSGYGKRKKIIENLRIIKPSHKMIKRFKKEEEVFDILKNSRLEEIEEEKEKRITEVKSDIEEQVFQNKLKAKNIARKNYIENNDTLLIVGVLVGAVVAIVFLETISPLSACKAWTSPTAKALEEPTYKLIALLKKGDPTEALRTTVAEETKANKYFVKYAKLAINKMNKCKNWICLEEELNKGDNEESKDRR